MAEERTRFDWRSEEGERLLKAIHEKKLRRQDLAAEKGLSANSIDQALGYWRNRHGIARQANQAKKAHKKVQVKKAGEFRCPVCKATKGRDGKPFASQAAVNFHITRAHRKARQKGVRVGLRRQYRARRPDAVGLTIDRVSFTPWEDGNFLVSAPTALRTELRLGIFIPTTITVKPLRRTRG